MRFAFPDYKNDLFCFFSCLSSIFCEFMKMVVDCNVKSLIRMLTAYRSQESLERERRTLLRTASLSFKFHDNGRSGFSKNVDRDMVVLMAARASRLENQDAIDCAIVSMLDDPKEERAGITEVQFLPFNPTDKRTALTFIDSAGVMHIVSKGAPEQVVPEGTKESSCGPWEFVGLLPPFDPPRHDSAETIRKALDLGDMSR